MANTYSIIQTDIFQYKKLYEYVFHMGGAPNYVQLTMNSLVWSACTSLQLSAVVSVYCKFVCFVCSSCSVFLCILVFTEVNLYLIIGQCNYICAICSELESVQCLVQWHLCSVQYLVYDDLVFSDWVVTPPSHWTKQSDVMCQAKVFGGVGSPVCNAVCRITRGDLARYVPFKCVQK